MTIPDELFESTAYKVLKPCDKLLLIALYANFWDCSTFTISLNTPEEYGRKDGKELSRRVISLIRCGLLRVVSHKAVSQSGLGRQARIFEFTYKVKELGDEG